jgi:hypothetical protein
VAKAPPVSTDYTSTWSEKLAGCCGCSTHGFFYETARVPFPSRRPINFSLLLFVLGVIVVHVAVVEVRFCVVLEAVWAALLCVAVLDVSVSLVDVWVAVLEVALWAVGV